MNARNAALGLAICAGGLALGRAVAAEAQDASLPAFVQEVHKKDVSDGSATPRATFDSPKISLTAGNLAVVVWTAFIAGTPTTVTVTDTAGNTWDSTSIPQAQSAFSHAGVVGMAFCSNLKGNLTNDVITVKFSPPAVWVQCPKVLEYRNVATSRALDATAIGTGTKATVTSGPFSTDAATELIVAAAVDHSEQNTWSSGTIAGEKGAVRVDPPAAPNGGTMIMDRVATAKLAKVTAAATDGGETEPYANAILVATFRGAANQKPMPQWDGKESIAVYARRVGLGPAMTLDLGEGVKLELVLVPAGKFLMGSPTTETGRYDDETQHEVTISKPFYMGKYHVTVGQFRRFVAATGHMTDVEAEGSKISWKDPGFKQTDDHPVVYMATDPWAFTAWARKLTGKAVRLPSEAEWEYACRAGSQTEYCSGNGLEAMKKVGWCSYDGKLGSAGGTRPVGSFQPNAWGLYDMHGNAWQVCQNRKGVYPKEPTVDPQPAFGMVHGNAILGWHLVSRGGSWMSIPSRCRSAMREEDHSPKGINDSIGGFRVVVEPVFSKTP